LAPWPAPIVLPLDTGRTSLTADAKRVLAAQALRAFAYGLGAVLVGSTLSSRGLTGTEVGLVLAAVVTGTVLAQLAVARFADSWGRRRMYIVLYAALGLVGIVFAFAPPLWAMVAVALTGALSTEVVESGPFTSLEQSMLAGQFGTWQLARGFGIYNAVATAAGSLGALAADLPAVARRAWAGAPPDSTWFALLVVAALAGAMVASTLSDGVEAARPATVASSGLGPSKSVVRRLSGLFALDAFAGGFVVQAYIAYWLSSHFGATLGQLAVLFFALGILQTVSFLVAPLLARRFGLLNTMVFTHLPSNLLLAAVAFAPTLASAVVLLVARTALSQMDVPTRQAYVMALVEPAERTAAAAYTNTARYVVRPVGPLLAGAAQALTAGGPFLIAGGLKSVYDLVLWRWFGGIDIDEPASRRRRGAKGSPRS
jgi:MFS family permease